MFFEGSFWLHLLCIGLSLSSLAYSAHIPRERQHARSVLSECQVDVTNITFAIILDCVRDRSLLYLDTITSTDTIDLLGGGVVKLVRRNKDTVINAEPAVDQRCSSLTNRLIYLSANSTVFIHFPIHLQFHRHHQQLARINQLNVGSACGR